MSRLGRLVGVMGVWALVLVPTSGAQASHGGEIDITWNAPDTSEVSGTEQVQGSFTVDNDSPLVPSLVLEWRIALKARDGSVADTELCRRTYVAESVPDFDFDWDTRSTAATDGDNNDDQDCNEASGTLIPNGDDYYLELAERDSADSDEWVTTTLDVDVNNPPARPKNADSGFDDSSQRVSVTWTHNNDVEPDLEGYRVQECRKSSESQSCSGSDWETIVTAQPSAVAATFGVPGGGVYRYRVKAIRPTADGSGSLESSGVTAGDPIVLNAQDPTSTTTTTTPTNGATTTTSPPPGGTTTTTGPGSTTTTTAGPGGGHHDPDDPTSTLPGSFGGLGGTPGSSGAGGVERHRSSTPRLVQRSSTDPGYDETLPYGATDEVASGPRGLLAAENPVGLALVPIAGGGLAFVVAMQMRYVSRRAAAMAAGTGPTSLPLETVDVPDIDPPADASLGARDKDAGSFIRNWRRWLTPPSQQG